MQSIPNHRHHHDHGHPFSHPIHIHMGNKTEACQLFILIINSSVQLIKYAITIYKTLFAAHPIPTHLHTPTHKYPYGP